MTRNSVTSLFLAAVLLSGTSYGQKKPVEIPLGKEPSAAVTVALDQQMVLSPAVDISGCTELWVTVEFKHPKLKLAANLQLEAADFPLTISPAAVVPPQQVKAGESALVQSPEFQLVFWVKKGGQETVYPAIPVKVDYNQVKSVKVEGVVKLDGSMPLQQLKIGPNGWVALVLEDQYANSGIGRQIKRTKAESDPFGSSEGSSSTVEAGPLDLWAENAVPLALLLQLNGPVGESWPVITHHGATLATITFTK